MNKIVILVVMTLLSCTQKVDCPIDSKPLGGKGDRFIYKLTSDPWQKEVIWNGHDSNLLVTVYDSYDSLDGMALHQTTVLNRESDTVKFYQLYQKVGKDKRYLIFSHGWSDNIFSTFTLAYQGGSTPELLEEIKNHYK
jgi:hypothetical protein